MTLVDRAMWGRCSQKRGKERSEGRTECEWRYWVWKGRTGEGAARRQMRFYAPAMKWRRWGSRIE